MNRRQNSYRPLLDPHKSGTQREALQGGKMTPENTEMTPAAKQKRICQRGRAGLKEDCPSAEEDRDYRDL